MEGLLIKELLIRGVIYETTSSLRVLYMMRTPRVPGKAGLPSDNSPSHDEACPDFERGLASLLHFASDSAIFDMDVPAATALTVYTVR